MADLCSHLFECVVIDEGVKMKGSDTQVGRGIRQMCPKYRLVLTATPVKNRLPDIFWLAWWAAGGHEEATARRPYAGGPEEQEKFAGTFMLSEFNKTKATEDPGKKSRYIKLRPEICNLYLLWKALGPIVLRRRKRDVNLYVIICDQSADRVLEDNKNEKTNFSELAIDFDSLLARMAAQAAAQAALQEKKAGVKKQADVEKIKNERADAVLAIWQLICNYTGHVHESEILIGDSFCHWIAGRAAESPGEGRTSTALCPLLQPLSEPDQLGQSDVAFRGFHERFSDRFQRQRCPPCHQCKWRCRVGRQLCRFFRFLECCLQNQPQPAQLASHGGQSSPSPVPSMGPYSNQRQLEHGCGDQREHREHDEWEHRRR